MLKKVGILIKENEGTDLSALKDSAALRYMLGDDPAISPEGHHTQAENNKPAEAFVAAYQDSIMQSLLQLAEKQAAMAAETASTVNILAQELMATIQAGNRRSFNKQYQPAAPDGYYAGAIARGLEELEAAHNAPPLPSASLSGHDALAKAKTDHEQSQLALREAQKNLELAQQQVQQAGQEYKRLLEEQQPYRQSAPPMQPWIPDGEIQQPLHYAPTYEPAAQPPPAPQTLPAEPPLPSAADNGYMAAGDSDLSRNQVTAIPFASAEPAQAAETQAAPASLGALGQATTAVQVVAPVQVNVPAKQQEKKDSRLWQNIRFPILVLALVACLRFLVFDVVQVSGTSMMPYLHDMDSLISNKIIYKLQDPKRYDIVLLDAPDQSGYYIKRVIGLPNEHILIKEGKVYVNGALLSEEYLDNIYTNNDVNTIIPDGCYFVMGDNRHSSLDSRDDSIGCIAKEHINGKAVLRFFPLNSIKIL
jgi:signal peptidase I